MSDIFQVHQRSVIMANIRGSGSASTELRLIRVFATYDIERVLKTGPGGMLVFGSG
jgi:hypothetical protein